MLELPCAQNFQLVRGLAQRIGEGWKRGGQTHDAHGGLVEHSVTRGVQDLNRFQLPVAAHGDQHLQTAVDAVAQRRLRVVLIADGFHATAPVGQVRGVEGRPGRHRVQAPDAGIARKFLALRVEIRL